MNKEVSIKSFNNSWYNPGNKVKIALWYLTWVLFFKTAVPFSNRFKAFLLKIWGAEIGKGVVIKPRVTIKYPWNLKIGNYSWIGENSWIDNLAPVSVGSNVVVSQGAYLLTGNHDFTKTSFDLLIKEIILENGVWVGAKAIVAPGIKMKSHSMLTAGSVLTMDSDEYSIYQGNPAKKIKERIIN